MINIEQFDHVGIRITDRKRSVKYYELLGFKIEVEVDFDEVIVMKNANGVEINLVVNGENLNQGQNILMDVPEKYTGFTHVALRVGSIIATLKVLEKNNIAISQGPVTFGHDGHVSVFLRDPDRNTLELRGRIEDENDIPNLVFYDPND
jgi:catechol 2,3-dioxygenase-like lactoylglutathione lyase family enzyme